jgi:hypothetical protein
VATTPPCISLDPLRAGSPALALRMPEGLPALAPHSAVEPDSAAPADEHVTDAYQSETIVGADGPGHGAFGLHVWGGVGWNATSMPSA